MTDVLCKLRLIAVKRSLRDAQIGLRLGNAGLCLRHIRACHLADLEAVLGRAQLLGKHFDGVLTKVHDCLIADDIHVGRRRAEKHIDLGAAKILAAGFHLRLGALDIVIGAEAVEDVLLQRDLRALRIGRAIWEAAAGKAAQRHR